MDSLILWGLAIAAIWFFFFRDKEAEKPSKREAPDRSERTNEVSVAQAPRRASTPKVTIPFSDSGKTIWAGEPIELKFSYKSNGKRAQSRSVLVDRYFESGGNRYIAGHCLFKGAPRTFKTSRVTSKVTVAKLGMSFDISVIQKGFRERDLSFGEDKVFLDNHKKSTKRPTLHDGDSYDINPPVLAAFVYGSSSTKQVTTYIRQVKKRVGRVFVVGQESKGDISLEFRSDKIAEPIQLEQGSVSRIEFLEFLYSLFKAEFECKKGISQANRAAKLSKLGAIDWETEGLLSTSGYHVGKTKGVKQQVRREILSDLLLHDDLRDVDNIKYAREWGKASSKLRFTKLKNVLNSFLKTSEKRNMSSKIDLDQAIDEWRSDIAFLTKEFSSYGKGTKKQSSPKKASTAAV
ncbi:hypothetical protein [Shewanella sp. 6_MG-2023]|uniref:hypothetical protein n=1 Tax=Shewanella sp. 6_MG-2023 TaxID=3062660 RepID=UPI0026E24372|nr:hypothetical protein [Shewanella sp. 6_MG-2023]MDO6621086.1 hypothetical protein [Shewanella sp. 6_MG-2023]